MRFDVTPTPDEEQPQSGKSLWTIMGQPAPEPETSRESVPDTDDPTDSPVDVDSADNESNQDVPTEPAGDKPKGLWALMGGQANQTESETDTAVEESEEPAFAEANAEFKEADESTDEKIEEADDVGDSELDDSESADSDDQFELEDDGHDGLEIEDDPADLDDLGDLLPDPEPVAVKISTSRLPPGTASLAFGILAMLLSGLCLTSIVWLRVPATIAGVLALVYGYFSLSTCHRIYPERKIHVLPVGGIAAGLLGVFAGPAFLNELGESRRDAAYHRGTEERLARIGVALQHFHDERSRFPAGGIFQPDAADGSEIGMHGWMTTLLPYLGESELAAQIDRSVPWSDQANFPPLSRRVDSWLVPGVEYSSTKTGHAPAHFSGLGGEIETDLGRVHFGVFGRNSAVKQDDVIDGLSNTLMAGEIASSFPAWGEPDNWRSIDSGLSGRVEGFGNADNTGAHFLLGDGSVRFLSNRTSSRVLEQLATRDGSD